MNIDSVEKIVDSLLRRYENSNIKALVTLLPGIDATIMHFRLQRLHVYFDELASGDIELTEDEIQKEDFVHAYYATARAASRTRRREKIRLLARLFMNYTKSTKSDEDSTDAFDETLAVLDDLSYREFKILLILHGFEKDFPEGDGNRTVNSMRFWDDFINKVASEFGIAIDLVPGMMERLNRTGLYMTVTDTSVITTAGKASYYTGYLTPNYFTFIDWLGAIDV